MSTVIKQALVPAAAPRTRAASLTIPTGILTITSILVDQVDGVYKLVPLPRYNGIPILAIALLDLANSADFPANVFNDLPVPHFAMVLMAIGATFALVMSVVAFVDARRSLKNIKLLQQERAELLVKEEEYRQQWLGQNPSDSDISSNHTLTVVEEHTTIHEKSAHQPQQQDHLHQRPQQHQLPSAAPVVDPALLSLNMRDMRVEFFERCGMELVMGGAAFLVAVGTYMAIAGDNPRVYIASNLLSGYIGNAPTALYGLINTSWSVIAWKRARSQRKSALADLKKGHVRDALKSRAGSIERHAVLSGVTCLISGALGLLTPTKWEPYPVLLVCGLLFIFSTWVFRTRVAYVRPKLSSSVYPEHLVADEIHDELDHLLQVQVNAKAEKTFVSKASFGNVAINPFAINFGSVVRIGLFERFCEQVLLDETMHARLREEWGSVGKITYRDFLNINPELQPPLNEIAKSCIEKHGPLQVSIQIRFLLEALGTCLITTKGAPTRATKA